MDPAEDALALYALPAFSFNRMPTCSVVPCTLQEACCRGIVIGHDYMTWSARIKLQHGRIECLIDSNAGKEYIINTSYA